MHTDNHAHSPPPTPGAPLPYLLQQQKQQQPTPPLRKPRAAAIDMHAPMDVRFENISYHVVPRQSRALLPPKKLPPVQILHDISGHVPAGQSLAILGPSGCGKTSLLNILAARSPEPPSAGTVTFSGRPRQPRTKRRIGYVMQDDTFLSQLTVRETLDFTAAVRLPQSLSVAERDARVDQVLRRLRLTKCQDVRVGKQLFDKGISGGERKRLNIANELLHDPALLLADECTSGLDSSSAYTVIKFLSELCNEGRTVVVTIHQPSSQMFALFDRIMLLAAGRIAYCGPSEAMVAYFEAIDFPFPKRQYNPADYALELVIEKGENIDGEKSDQAQILDVWEARGQQVVDSILERTPPSRRRQVLTAKASSHPTNTIDGDTSDLSATSPAHVVIPLHDEKSPSSDDTRSSGDKPSAPSTSTHEPLHDAPSSQFERFLRVVRKRFYDLTGQHGADGREDKYPTDWVRQVHALGQRAVRKKQGLLTEMPSLIQLISITMIMSVLWFRMRVEENTVEDRLGSLSFIPIFWMVFSTLNALYTFPAERDVLTKDRASGSYRLSAYVLSKMVVELPADTLYPILASTITYYIVNLNPDVRAFLIFLVIITLNNIVAQSFGLFISAAIFELSTAQVIAGVGMQLLMVSSGYLVNPDNLPVVFRVFRQVNFLKIAYEGLVQNEMSFGRTIACNVPPQPFTEYSSNGQVCPITREQLIDAAQISGAPSIAVGILYQVLFIVVFRLLSYVSLKFLHTRHKPRGRFWREGSR